MMTKIAVIKNIIKNNGCRPETMTCNDHVCPYHTKETKYRPSDCGLIKDYNPHTLEELQNHIEVEYAKRELQRIKLKTIKEILK